MALRRGAPSAALTAAKPNPFQAMQEETQAPDETGMKKPPMSPMPSTMNKSHTPPGVKRRPFKPGKL